MRMKNCHTQNCKFRHRPSVVDKRKVKAKVKFKLRDLSPERDHLDTRRHSSGQFVYKRPQSQCRKDPARNFTRGHWVEFVVVVLVVVFVLYFHFVFHIGPCPILGRLRIIFHLALCSLLPRHLLTSAPVTAPLAIAIVLVYSVLFVL